MPIGDTASGKVAAITALLDAAAESRRSPDQMIRFVLTGALALAGASIVLVCRSNGSVLESSTAEGVPEQAIGDLASASSRTLPQESIADDRYIARIDSPTPYLFAMQWPPDHPAEHDLARVVRSTVERLLRRIQDEPDPSGGAIDPLTELPSRTATLQHLDNVLVGAQRSGRHVGVLFIDLDGFKAINDTFGHAVGDWVLIEAARRMKDSVPRNDFVGRLGGDEFIAVLAILDDELEMVDAAQRFLERVVIEVQKGGFTSLVRASVGIAVAPEDGITPEQLLQHADIALSVAKKSGGNCARWYGDFGESRTEQTRPRTHRALQSYRLQLTGTDDTVAIRSKVTQAGLTGAALRALRDRLDLTITEMARILGAGERTVIRKEQERSALSTTEADRAYRLARTADLAVELIGDDAKAKSWLRTPSAYLGGEAPIAMLDTEVGTELVVQSLYAIAHGGVA